MEHGSALYWPFPHSSFEPSCSVDYLREIVIQTTLLSGIFFKKALSDFNNELAPFFHT